MTTAPTETVDSDQPTLCRRCDDWFLARSCFRAVDEIPYFTVLCSGCLTKCPQRVAEHYAPMASGATA